MTILTKPLDAITIADLQSLCDQDMREGEELEFKGTLPFRPDPKGMPGATADRWIQHGDRIGTFARDELLAELVAFANTGGGTLILGLHESEDEPRRAEWLEAIPNCEALAQRLLDACDGVVEPRLPLVQARGLPADETGAGFVVIRVGSSALAPHRLNSTREFYKRRGERSERMTVREITDMTLQLARSGDRIEGILSDRERLGREMFQRLVHQAGALERALVIRVTAVPTMPLHVPQLTARQNLWWRGQSFVAELGGRTERQEFPARHFGGRPDIRLRQFHETTPLKYPGIHRTLRDDGLVEFAMHGTWARTEGIWSSEFQPVPLVWPLQLLVGALAQVQALRAAVGQEATEFGITATIETSSASALHLGSAYWDQGGSKDERFTSMPRYSVGSVDTFAALANAFALDLQNAWGLTGGLRYELEWAPILAGSTS